MLKYDLEIASITAGAIQYFCLQVQEPQMAIQSRHAPNRTTVPPLIAEVRDVAVWKLVS